MKESPDKQKAISRAVALNDSCVLWGNILQKAGTEIKPEDKTNIEEGVLKTADIFYEWLSKQEAEPPTEQDKLVISEVMDKVGGVKKDETKPPTKPTKPTKPTPPPAQTHINCTQCGSVVEMGQECPRCKETGNPWHSDKAKRNDNKSN